MKTKQLPQEWKEVELGDKNYFKILSSGISDFEGEKDYLSTESIKGTIINKIKCKITQENRPSRANMQPVLNSIWFAKMQSTLKVYCFDEDNKEETETYILSTGFAGIKIQEDKVYPKYLRLIFTSKFFNKEKDSLSAGSTQKGIKNSFITKIKIPLPPLSAQKKIVQVLEQAEQLKQKREQANKLMEDYLKSVFNELFFNKKFKTRKLDEIKIEFRYGTSNKSGEQGYSVLGIPNILGQRINFENVKRVKLTKDELDRLRLVKGDILFVRTNGNPNYIGRCGIFNNLKEDFVFASYLIRCRLGDEVLPLFVKYYLETNFGRKLLRSKCKTTAGQYNINTHGLGDLDILFPPLPLQQKFVSIVKKVEEVKEKQKQSYLEINNLFNVLMQKAFRGELLK